MRSFNKKDTLHPKITFEQIIDLGTYQRDKEKFTCKLCEEVLMNPLCCSSCNRVYCKDCVFPYVMTNNQCPNGCNTFELVKPSGSLLKAFNNFELLCKGCYSSISLIDFLFHYRQCIASEEIVNCWNCGMEKRRGELKYRKQEDYNIRFNYDNNLSINDDHPFKISIKTEKFEGFAAVNEDYLIVVKEKENASIFSQLDIMNKSYIKVFIDSKWKFLCPDYSKGVEVTNWNSCGSIEIDTTLKSMTSRDGITKGDSLVMKESNNKLYFYKGSNSYLPCEIKLIYIEKMT